MNCKINSLGVLKSLILYIIDAKPFKIIISTYGTVNSIFVENKIQPDSTNIKNDPRRPAVPICSFECLIFFFKISFAGMSVMLLEESLLFSLIDAGS